MSRRSWQVLTLLAATLTMGLTAGVFGDWAHTIMRALGTTDDRTFVGAFQALDRAILNPLFMLAFMGALAFTGVAAVLYRRDSNNRSPLPWVAVAFGLYLAAFVITMAVHEPLNVVIRAAGDPDRIADPAAVRDAFHETRWVTWHIVRTTATIAAFGCLAWALVLHGRASTDHEAPRPASVATRSKILRWESVAWVVIGTAWIVSAWPGLLVQWDGLPMAALTGLGVLAGFVAWHVIAHGARLGRPGTWVGHRGRAGRPGQPAKSRKHLAAAVAADAVGWSLSAIGWCVAAAVFDWSETLTGAPLLLAFGVAFIGWGLLHIPAARLLAAPDADLAVLSRRVLGSGPPTLDMRSDKTGQLASTAVRTNHAVRQARPTERGAVPVTHSTAAEDAR